MTLFKYFLLLLILYLRFIGTFRNKTNKCNDEILLSSKYGITFIENIKKNNCIIMSTLTNNIVDTVKNFYFSSLLPFNITNYVFVATDRESYLNLKSQKYNVVLYLIEYKNNSNDYDYKSYNYYKSTNSRLNVICFLLSMNINIFIFDSDVKFFKNPIPLLRMYAEDIVVGCDNKKCIELNTGQ